MIHIRKIALFAFSIVAFVAAADDYMNDRWNRVSNAPRAADTPFSMFPIYFTRWRPVIPGFIRASDMAWGLECSAYRRYIAGLSDSTYDYRQYTALATNRICELFAMIDDVRKDRQDGTSGWVKNESMFSEKIPWNGGVGNNTITQIFGNDAIHNSGFTNAEKSEFYNAVLGSKILRSSHFKSFVFDKMNGINSYVRWFDLHSFQHWESWWRTSGGTVTYRTPYEIISDTGSERFPYHEGYVNPEAYSHTSHNIIYLHNVTISGTPLEPDIRCEMKVGYFKNYGDDEIRFTQSMRRGLYDSPGGCFALICFSRTRTIDGTERINVAKYAVVNVGDVYPDEYWSSVFSGNTLTRLMSIANQLGITDDVSMPSGETTGVDNFSITLVGYCLRVDIDHAELTY